MPSRSWGLYGSARPGPCADRDKAATPTHGPRMNTALRASADRATACSLRRHFDSAGQFPHETTGLLRYLGPVRSRIARQVRRSAGRPYRHKRADGEAAAIPVSWPPVIALQDAR